jgi:hypothetical protein
MGNYLQCNGLNEAGNGIPYVDSGIDSKNLRPPLAGSENSFIQHSRRIPNESTDLENRYYLKGYDTGYEIGHDSGYETGYNEGYEEGQYKGYETGYNEGHKAIEVYSSEQLQNIYNTIDKHVKQDDDIRDETLFKNLIKDYADCYYKFEYCSDKEVNDTARSKMRSIIHSIKELLLNGYLFKKKWLYEYDDSLYVQFMNDFMTNHGDSYV